MNVWSQLAREGIPQHCAQWLVRPKGGTCEITTANHKKW
jgi:hypothetical protein